MEQREHFELDFKGDKIKVRKRTVSGRVIYGIHFNDGRQDLVITRAIHADAFNFWTSLPEGRQKEAEEVGSVIAAHFKEDI